MRRLTSLPAETDACLACMQLPVRQVLDQPAKHMWACKRCLVLDSLAALPYMGMALSAVALEASDTPTAQYTVHAATHCTRCHTWQECQACLASSPGRVRLQALCCQQCWPHSSISEAAKQDFETSQRDPPAELDIGANLHPLLAWGGLQSRERVSCTAQMATAGASHEHTLRDVGTNCSTEHPQMHLSITYTATRVRY